MKRFLPFSALLAPLVLAGGHLASGQNSHSLSLDVQSVSAGNSVSNSANTQTGTTGRAYSSANVRLTKSKETLQINLRNFGVLPDNAHVEWYFVAAPTHPTPGKSDDDQEFVFDQGARDLVLPGGGTQAITAESTEVTSAVRTSARGGSGRSSRRSTFSMPRAGQKPQESGSSLRGWLVRVVTADGKVAATRGSSQAYEDLAKDNAKLADLTDNQAPPAATGKAAPYKKRATKAHE